MVRSQCLKPINKILWVVKSGVETIDAEQLDDIMAGKAPRPPKDWVPRNPPSSDGGNSSSGGSSVVEVDSKPVTPAA